MSTARVSPVPGFLLAIGSAACFALSGILASALMSAGWSAVAAATARISLAALVLSVPTLIMMRGSWHLVRAAWSQVVLFGVLAVAGCQLAFFLAVQFIAPSLALVIEFMAPVLLIFWVWARTRSAPTTVTLIGAAIAVLGLLTVSGVGSADSLHPLGILFALGAAIGLAAFFAMGANVDHRIPPLPYVGLGLMVASVVLLIVSATGVLPFAIGSGTPVVAGIEAPAWLVVAALVFFATVTAYVLGVAAARRLGATVASFTGYSEPLFGIVWTIVLLGILPTQSQWIGAAFIIVGVVAVKVGQLRGTARSSPASVEV
jgi:drug/metabolite transporter (DMT)-like permease